MNIEDPSNVPPLSRPGLVLPPTVQSVTVPGSIPVPREASELRSRFAEVSAKPTVGKAPNASAATTAQPILIENDLKLMSLPFLSLKCHLGIRSTPRPDADA
jgi:hypothetical protein